MQITSRKQVRYILAKIEQANTINNVAKDRVENAKKHIELLHNKADKKDYICIALKHSEHDGVWEQYHFKYDTLIDNIDKILAIKGWDTYISPNSFWKAKRLAQDVRKMNAYYVDLDYYNIAEYKGLEPFQIKALLEQDMFNSEVPQPSYIVDTGRGLAIYWSIKGYLPKRAILAWKRVQNFLIDSFKEHGADPKVKDIPRVMRLAGTVNHKTNRVASLQAYSNIEYDTRDIRKDYIDDYTDRGSLSKIYKGSSKKSNVVKIDYFKDTHKATLSDLETLQKLRGGYSLNGEAEGLREFMCFLYAERHLRVFGDISQAIKSTQRFNGNFVEPINDKELAKAIKSAEKSYHNWIHNIRPKDSQGIEYDFGGYNYKIETLVGILQIKEEEMKSLKILTSKEYKKWKKNERNKLRKYNARRDKFGRNKQEQAKFNNMLKIYKLRIENPDWTQTRIAKEIEVNKSTVSRYVREIDKDIEAFKKLVEEYKSELNTASERKLHRVSPLHSFDTYEVSMSSPKRDKQCSVWEHLSGSSGLLDTS